MPTLTPVTHEHMVFDTGYVALFSVRGVPVRAHWSTPFGAVLFSRFEFAPGYWLGFLALIILHELGHATLVKRRGLEPLSADVHAFGGQCRYHGPETPFDRSIIAWGGVLAQMVVLVACWWAVNRLGWPQPRFLRDLLHAGIYTNLLLIGLNLLPVPPFDGHHAWKIFGFARWHRARAKAENNRRETPDTVSTAGALVRESLKRAQRDAARAGAASRSTDGPQGFANTDRKC